MIPYRCPICNGTGNVPGGFYNCVPGGTPTSTNTSEKCQSCINGVIYDCTVEGIDPYHTQPPDVNKVFEPLLNPMGDAEDTISVLKDIRKHLLTIIEELQTIG